MTQNAGARSSLSSHTVGFFHDARLRTTEYTLQQNLDNIHELVRVLYLADGDKIGAQGRDKLLQQQKHSACSNTRNLHTMTL